MIDLVALESELKKRLSYPPTPWDRRQNNAWDKETGFIYQIKTWEGLLAKVQGFSRDKCHYAVNRWFNFWSARGVEEIFCRQPGVVPGPAGCLFCAWGRAVWGWHGCWPLFYCVTSGRGTSQAIAGQDGN
jgi:hypothetical protein